MMKKSPSDARPSRARSKTYTDRGYVKGGSARPSEYDARLRANCRKGTALLAKALVAGGYENLVGSPQESAA
jgi:hypothetical protein